MKKETVQIVDNKEPTIFEKYQTLRSKCELYTTQQKPQNYAENNSEKYDGTTSPVTYETSESQISSIKQLFDYHKESKGINYDIENNLLYCFSAKTGTTNWKTMAASIRRNITMSEMLKNRDSKEINIYKDTPSLFRLTNELNFTDTESRDFKPAHGIISARHPLIRLYSAWAHRLSDSLPYHRKFFHRQIKYIKDNFDDSQKQKPEGIFVTFSGFLKFVATNIAHESLQDLHWWRIHKRCHLCEHIDLYDAVVNTETAAGDGSQFLKIVGKEWIGKFPEAYDTVRLKFFGSAQKFGSIFWPKIVLNISKKD